MTPNRRGHGLRVVWILAAAILSAPLWPQAAFSQPAPGSSSAASSPASAGPARRGAAPSAPAGRLETVSSIMDTMAHGAHAVMFLGLEKFDARICDLYAYAYRNTFIVQSDKLVYFPRQQEWNDAKPGCNPIKAAYNGDITANRLVEPLLTPLPPAPILMVVCTSPSGKLINKGFVAFNPKDGDNDIKAHFDHFNTYFSRGQKDWMDSKWIDRPGPDTWLGHFADWGSTAWDYVPIFGRPKNTDCRP